MRPSAKVFHDVAGGASTPAITVWIKPRGSAMVGDEVAVSIQGGFVAENGADGVYPSVLVV